METNNKLREALEMVRDAHYTKEVGGEWYEGFEVEADDGTGSPLICVVEDALAEPVKNCEVGTAEEQAKRMDAYCASCGERIGGSWRCDNCPLCSIDRCELAWAQMPYVEKEGGAK